VTSEAAVEEVHVGPNAGPQTQAIASSADITLTGGAAGGGKSWATLFRFGLHAARHERYYGAIFRREMPQVTMGGGIWEESLSLYPMWNARPNLGTHEWRFPNTRSLVQFRGLQHAKDVIDYQGAQFSEFAFEEATHFEEVQFWYLYSRLRSQCGMRPRCFLTCNPDPDSWVAKMVRWWIGDDGYALPERAGLKRYFVRDGDELLWGDTADEVRERGAHVLARQKAGRPQSFRFIPAMLSDNPKGDPDYASKLMALSLVDRMRLLGGNWKIRPAAGTVFKRAWFEIIDRVPHDVIGLSRGWDLAATLPSTENKEPDWTRGVKTSRHASGLFVVQDVKSLRDRPYAVDQLVHRTTRDDGRECRQCFWQDPGAAGKSEAERYLRELAGWDVRIVVAAENKQTYAKPVSAQAEGGNVKLLRGDWNESYLNELEAFPTPGVKDDQVDGTSRVFLDLTTSVTPTPFYVPGL
jgi:predicted phage terminase large subunit-like protein